MNTTIIIEDFRQITARLDNITLEIRRDALIAESTLEEKREQLIESMLDENPYEAEYLSGNELQKRHMTELAESIRNARWLQVVIRRRHFGHEDPFRTLRRVESIVRSAEEDMHEAQNMGIQLQKNRFLLALVQLSASEKSANVVSPLEAIRARKETKKTLGEKITEAVLLVFAKAAGIPDGMTAKTALHRLKFKQQESEEARAELEETEKLHAKILDAVGDWTREDMLASASEQALRAEMERALDERSADPQAHKCWLGSEALKTTLEAIALAKAQHEALALLAKEASEATKEAKGLLKEAESIVSACATMSSIAKNAVLGDAQEMVMVARRNATHRMREVTRVWNAIMATPNRASAQTWPEAFAERGQKSPPEILAPMVRRTAMEKIIAGIRYIPAPYATA